MDEDRLREFYAQKGVEWVEVYMQSNQMNALQKPVAVQWLADQKKAQKSVEQKAQLAIMWNARGAHLAAWIAVGITLVLAFWR